MGNCKTLPKDPNEYRSRYKAISWLQFDNRFRIDKLVRYRSSLGADEVNLERKYSDNKKEVSKNFEKRSQRQDVYCHDLDGDFKAREGSGARQPCATSQRDAPAAIFHGDEMKRKRKIRRLSRFIVYLFITQSRGEGEKITFDQHSTIHDGRKEQPTLKTANEIVSFKNKS